MNRILIFFTITGLLFSCNPKKKNNNDEEKPSITVSILPQKTFVEKIAGNDFKINVLIPPGASPAAYTLLPSQLKSISKSEVWFRIGYIGFEYSWKDKIRQTNKKMRIVDLSEGLDLIMNEVTSHGENTHLEGIDPHVWLSPSLVKQMSAKIAQVLSEINPERKDFYNANYRKFAVEIDQLDQNIRSTLESYKGRQIVTYHPSLSYYIRDYGLIQYSLEPGGKEPSPQHMAKVIELAKKEGINVIYIQSEFDREHARVFAEELNGEIVQVAPLNPDWANNLMEITDVLVKHF